MSTDDQTTEGSFPPPYEQLMGTGKPLSDANFERLSRFIYNYCGIRITTTKRTMIDGRLRRRMRALGMSDINAYCDFLFADNSENGQAEIVHFIDAITTNKTDFFRENSHFDYLRDEILPKLSDSGRRNIRIWSAACSTGAEPYTLAMVMEEFRLVRPDIDYTILSSDISTAVLTKAISGRFPQMMIDPIPEEIRRRYVLISRDPKGREFRIKPQLRSKVAFFQLNLMDEIYSVAHDMDVIFCRNVLIYFDRPTQAMVLKRLSNHLRRGGYLVLGHSETIAGLDLPLKTVSNTIFKRR